MLSPDDETIADNLKLWVKSDIGVQKNTEDDQSPSYENAASGELVARWQDQSGNGHDLTQLVVSEGAFQPVYVVDNAVASVCIDYWRRDISEGGNKWLTIPEGLETDPREFTVIAVVELNTVDRNNYILTLGNSHSGQDTDRVALVVEDGVLKIEVETDSDARATEIPVPSSKCVIAWRATPEIDMEDGFMTVFLNSLSATEPADPVESSFASTVQGGEISGANGGWFKAFELAVYDQALSDEVIGKLIAYAVARHSITVAPATRIIIDGDSLSEGLGATLNQPFWRILGDHENLHVTCHAQSGETLADAIDDSDEVDRLLAQASENWFLCKLGTNDLNTLSTAENVYTALKNYCADRKAAGAHKVVVWTINLISDTSSINVQVNELNEDRLRPDFTVPTGSPYVFAAKPGTTYADYLVDIAAHPLIGTGSDAAGTSAIYWVEADIGPPFIHLTDAGYALEAAVIGEGLFAGVASKAQGAAITVGDEDLGTNMREITVQLLTKDGRPTIGRHQIRLVVYEDAAGTTIATDAGSTGIALKTGGGAGTFLTLTAKKIFIATCEEDGHIDLTWTDSTTGGHAVYLGVLLPNGRVVVSEKIHNPN